MRISLLAFFVVFFMLSQLSAYAASCPKIFDEIEPGFCHRQEQLDNQKVNHFESDYSYSPYSDPRFDHVNFYPMYDSAASIDISGKEAALIAGVAASAIVVFNNDEELMNFVQNNKNNVTEVVANWGEKMGSMPTLLGAGGYVLAMVMDNGEVKDTSLMVVKATLVSGLITRAIKMSFSRKRPNAGERAYEFSGFDISNNDVSFPSGHTTSAFAFATVIAEKYKDQSSLIPVLAYGAAAIGGWSRMHANAHWGSDVLIGALIGHLTAKKMMAKPDDSRSKYDLSFYPVFAEDYNGIYVQFKGKKKKDTSSKRFFDKCHKYYDENPSYEDPVRLCMSHYLNSVWLD